MNEFTLRMKSVLLFFLLFGLAGQLQAHQPDQSYLYFRIFADKVEGSVEMSIKDINLALDKDIDPSKYYKEKNAEFEKLPLPAEWAIHTAELKEYLISRIKIKNENQPVQITFTDFEILGLSRAVYIIANFDLQSITTVPKNIDIEYDVLFDKYDHHRGLAIIGHHWEAGVINNEAIHSLIFSPNDKAQRLSLEDISLWKGFIAMLKLGMWHIYIGVDHIFFLLALILPAVIKKRGRENRSEIEPVEGFKAAFWYILKIVTLFTIAHSITLSLAALGIIQMESWLVESIIAISIGLAALHNIYPIFAKSENVIAFIFGLFHGLGFASVLGEKGIEGEYLALSLFGFNIGVEIGQVLIICALFPFLFFLRKKPFYKHILFYGSVFLILASLYWFVERFFDVNFLLDDYIGKAINKIFKIIGLK